jgi:uncharacterized repeat protein (TIGR03833 family)
VSSSPSSAARHFPPAGAPRNRIIAPLLPRRWWCPSCFRSSYRANSGDDHRRCRSSATAASSSSSRDDGGGGGGTCVGGGRRDGRGGGGGRGGGDSHGRRRYGGGGNNNGNDRPGGRRRRTDGGIGPTPPSPGRPGRECHRTCVPIDADVYVVRKEDQRTGRETRGVVSRHLTRTEYHPRGIKVMLADGVVGRVTRFAESNVTNDPL